MKVTKLQIINLILFIFLLSIYIYPLGSILIISITINNFGKIQLTNVTAKSGYWKDIQQAITLVVASGGIGNVYIPEGTFNFVYTGESWTGSRVIIPAGVNLFGAPTERDANGQVIAWKTTLVIPWDVPGNDTIGIPNWFEIRGYGDANKPSRFSDIHLQGYRTFDQDSITLQRGVVIYDVINFRVDHCFFENTCDRGVWATSDYWVAGPIYKICGVIDHCKFINIKGLPEPYETRTIGYGVCADRSSKCNLWEDDISKVLGKYTDYSVYIEDCYFEKWRHCISSNSGIHWVFRYNTISYDYAQGSIDAHGTYDLEGTRAIEVYNNQIINPVSFDSTNPRNAIQIRGGGGVIFNNTESGCPEFLVLSDDGTTPVKCLTKYVYVWSNEIGSSTLVSIQTGRTLTEEVDYFLHEPGTFTYTPYPYPHPITQEATP